MEAHTNHESNNNNSSPQNEKQAIEEAEKKARKAVRMANLKSGLCMGFGAVFVVFGAIAIVFWPLLFDAQLRNNMILREGSESYELWKETPIPMFLEFHIWNITNTEEILARTATKVRVEQLGPYVFREDHIKTNITFNSNGTVKFRNKRIWYFEPTMSNGSLSDEIVSVNPIILTVAHYSRFNNAFTNLALDVVLRMFHSNMFTKANATAWIFEGIDDPLLDAAELIPPGIINLPMDKFAWFYGRNGSVDFDGVFLMNTGENDFSQLGNLEKWNYANTTHYRGECGAVKGSTGELWAPELGQSEVYVFASDVCTYLTLARNDSIKVQGVDGVIFAANDSFFDNGHKYPSMACYCDEVRDDNCLPAGALNVSSCRLGAPAFVTLPHMFNVDPRYPSKIDGQTPLEEHRFRMALEMFTGIPLLVDAQLQINLLVRHVAGMSINNILPDEDTLVPMFWFRQEVRLTPEYARLARFALLMRNGVPYAMYALTSLGVLLLAGGIYVLVRRLMHAPDTVPLVEDDVNE